MALGDQWLDTEPQSVTKEKIRRTLGVTPPDLDGWSYGEATNALVPIST